jgi:hypothetical protein
MSVDEPKKTPIFSDEFKLKVSKFTTSVYSDYEGLVMFSSIIIGVLLFLLTFWWHTIGPLAEFAYIRFWTERYPTTPIELSNGYQNFQLLDLITTFAFWIILGFWVIIIAVIIIKRSNKVKPVVEQPKLPVQKPYSGQECMYCSSKKIRNGGKDNPDKMYCKSCRRFF